MRSPAIMLALAALAGAERPHVVFVTGDDEYRSEITMPMIAEILDQRHGMRTTVLYARPNVQTRNNIEGLEALASADLAVFFLRWRELPEDQLQPILDYIHSGKPIAGLRPTTHLFRYPAASPRAALNDDFPREVFGQRWIRHHGHRSSTAVAAAPDHEILNGVERSFDVRSWLYQVTPLSGDAQPLLMGRAVNPEGADGGPNPVAWTKTYRGARVFFATLGHPEDFTVESVRRLLLNGIYWALGRPVPKGGADARPVKPYVAPPTNPV